MTYGKLVWLVCGVTLAAFSTGISSGYAAEIPSPVIEKDYESCLAQGAAGQEEFQTRYCRCFVDRMQDGMDFEEYILVASGFDLENMSN